MKTIVLFSGGLDSTVVLAQAIAQGDVLALTFDYAQSNHIEVKQATRIAALWGCPHRVVEIDLEKSDARFEIPARNTIFLAHALEVALLEKADFVAYGAEPDATYCDSSLEYIAIMQQLFRLHGVTLLAPVKELADKTEVLITALDLGVPLHLIHSSRTNNVMGCGTSARLMKAMQYLFPYANPFDLFARLADAFNDNPLDLRTPQTGSFKYFPALLTVAHSKPTEEPYKIYTTGNWGKSLEYCCQALDNPLNLQITQISLLNMLAKSELSTASKTGQWGIKQALSQLPRPRYLGCNLSFPVTQGHLRHAVESLGYNVDLENGIKLLTGWSKA